jgi:hypothetical protein
METERYIVREKIRWRCDSDEDKPGVQTKAFFLSQNILYSLNFFGERFCPAGPPAPSSP